MNNPKRNPILGIDCTLLILWGGAAWYFFAVQDNVPFSGRDLLYLSGYALFSVLCAALAGASRKRGVRLAGWLHGLVFAFVAASAYWGGMYYAGLGTVDLRNDILAVLQSDVAESLDFFTGVIFTPARLAVSALVVLGVVALVYGNSALFRERLNNAKREKAAAATAFLSFALAIFLFSQISGVKYATEQYVRYYKSLHDFEQLHGQLSQREPVAAIKKETGELYVLIIGESENRDLMDCYTAGTVDGSGSPGVPGVSNTPWMDGIRRKAGYTVFNNAYAAHVLTMQVLRLALAEGDNLTGDTFADGAPNIISIAGDAGMKTVWLSNQRNLGKRDNDVSALAATAGTHFFTVKEGRLLNQKSPPDEALLPVIEQELDNLDFSRNTLLIIHLMGNHFPYRDRYPEDFGLAPLPDPDRAGAAGGDAKAQRLLGEYLTSVRYIDSMLECIDGLLRRYAERPVAVVYFADHGEELFDRRGGGHNPATFTWNMSRIPMWTWLSDGYRERYPDVLPVLNSHAGRVFTNDHIYMLFLGLAHIETGGYREQYDISSPAYSLTADEALLFNGKKVADDPRLQHPAP